VGEETRDRLLGLGPDDVEKTVFGGGVGGDIESGVVCLDLG
jgi:hypothetical protein